ncbi:uncharacterized protein LOC106875983 [Octopus bimaculoides]|nr:uncharacterized protein LOC106875983 [Octopus bimaculoides]XP_052826733.1 uncharacterized protein LOC106875983 [Octopus bimaculoides]XP_052826734.1 uncharacterized protein LOC106875983 [Octopus bimaculoides]XP_052826735.1 uncharacterized protein LOC106875983 [Octopus bimaculoides]XP_052826736.1 uncharacterized protein LOC106875983 [Octopus bimaculoides]XP_052826737.1 uncharacterized protein LOC106875983 [Octopus bimaculoides]XP_052826739.1 uncharacterized protein LOC106875983 [Octopus bima|eukprot:XP_014779812.1 PREDICTED: uncharacterized protein LOC106875983 [Octopus bimaculoides]
MKPIREKSPAASPKHKKGPKDPKKFAQLPQPPADMSATTPKTQVSSDCLDSVENAKKLVKNPPEIVLGLETEDGACALVEIDDIIDDSNLAPEDITGNVRRSSITEKLNKSRESEAKVAEMKVRIPTNNITLVYIYTGAK